MNKPAKYFVALAAGVAAVGVVAVVAVPIVSKGAEIDDMTATMQQVVPTVVGSSADGHDIDAAHSWTLDAGSSVGYRVGDADSPVVTGRTEQISGAITRTDTAVTDAEFMVDLSTLVGDDLAKAAMLDALIRATGGNSVASFVLTSPAELPESGEGTVPIVGTLTLRGVSHQVEGEASISFDDSSAVIEGSIPIELADYGIPVPSLGGADLGGSAAIDVDLVASPR